MLRRVFVVLALIAGCGCGNSKTGDGLGSYSCDLRTGTMNLYVCRDYEGVNSQEAATLQTDCVDPNQHGGTAGTWSSTLCSHANSLGGCRAVTGDETITIWSYPGNGNTVTNVMNACSSAMATYVAP